MKGENEDLSAFLKSLGFTDEELSDVMDELNSYRSIPGTTLGRYINRVINALAADERLAFLKGIMMGVAIRKIVDALEEPDQTDEEKRIDREIEKLGLEHTLE